MTTLPADTLMAQKETRISETISRERGRLSDFIRRRVPDPSEAEDILQDVFFEFVEAYRLPEPIEQIGAWLYRVARNRIIDRFRKRKEQPLPQTTVADDEDSFALALPAPEGGPEGAYLRSALLTEIARALDELPKAQRDVFVAHELEGRSFKELAAESGVAVNTLLTRKRHAVLHLRARLLSIYNEFDR